MDIMNEIDRLLAMDSEKVESAEDFQPEFQWDGQQASDYDPDFFDILNEISGGEVSTSENNENATYPVTSVFAEAEELAQLNRQDTTPFYKSSSVASNLFVNETNSPAETQVVNVSTDSVVTITYQLDDQQTVIFPTKLSQDRKIPVVVTDTLPFKLINGNSEITSATTADNSCSGEASATTITASSCGSRKRKLYEEEEFSDPAMEKKRQNAINAKKHRNKTKETIQNLQQRLDTKEQECDALTREVEDMARKMERDQNAHNMESAALRTQNEDLKRKLQILTFLTS